MEATEQQAQEQPIESSNVVPLQGGEPEKSEKVLTLDQRMKELEAQLEVLEAQRQKTVVEELELEPEALAAVAKSRRKERWPFAQKEVEKHLKQLAWSGENTAYLEPKSPIFNDMLMKWLKEIGFKCELISLGGNQGHKIKVEWKVR